MKSRLLVLLAGSAVFVASATAGAAPDVSGIARALGVIARTAAHDMSQRGSAGDPPGQAVAAVARTTGDDNRAGATPAAGTTAADDNAAREAEARGRVAEGETEAGDDRGVDDETGATGATTATTENENEVEAGDDRGVENENEADDDGAMDEATTSTTRVDNSGPGSGDDVTRVDNSGPGSASSGSGDNVSRDGGGHSGRH